MAILKYYEKHPKRILTRKASSSMYLTNKESMNNSIGDDKTYKSLNDIPDTTNDDDDQYKALSPDTLDVDDSKSNSE